MNSSKEIAEAIFIVIKRVSKIILILGLVLIAATLAISLLSDWWRYETHQKHADRVIISISYAPKNRCPDLFPYIYTIENLSLKTVEEVQFSLAVRKKGYSRKINQYTNFSSDKILKPSESWSECVRITSNDNKTDLNEADVEIDVSFKDVKFIHSD